MQKYIAKAFQHIVKDAMSAINSVAGLLSRKLDMTGPGAETYGWRDLMGEITVRGAGPNSPDWVVFRDGIHGYGFTKLKLQEVWQSFHLNHDYAKGTPLLMHIHWAPITAATGTVRWGFEYTTAKGHAQNTDSVFPQTTTIYAEETVGEGGQYKHHVSEITELDGIALQLEPDTLVLVRAFRDALHVNDTFPDTVVAFQMDAHYQVDRYATERRAPDFYTPA